MDLADTFFKTPVTYNLFQEVLDRHNEDRTNPDYTTYSLRALVEYPDAMLPVTLQGQETKQNVKVTFNYEDLAAEGLTDAEYKVVFNELKDTFVVNGITYTHAKAPYYDGPLDRQNVLVIIEGLREEQYT